MTSSVVRLYHRTLVDRADSILVEGWSDTAYDAEPGMERGVWFCENLDTWAVANPALLAIDVPEDRLRPEWRSAVNPAEWLIPSRCLRELSVDVVRLA